MAPKLKLTYFNIGGRAEMSRLAFAIGDVPFEDERIARDEFLARKEGGKLPMGSLPVLEVDGKMVCQSEAIFYYACKLAGIFPEDPFDLLKMHEVAGAIQDITSLIMPTFAEPDLDKKIAKRKELVAGPLGAKIAALNKLLKDNGKKYCISDEFTPADIQLYTFKTFMTSGMLDGIELDIFAPYERIEAISTLVAEHPKIVKWYADRKAAEGK
eukprot:CAMPEP_0181314648 /NCGR_PEP_ID=MMETSP1101-20121128/14934_1 /TAXON_ID=46948 /ORGANISM="Rhodomonas abbreviata, Strain Caron Lab Isolate" /LENGTH=212 /DNA_ID=CAMNT_0023421763 /DNA_START=20 /DNA_END=658 /DNA_ORIENTATION=+